MKTLMSLLKSIDYLDVIGCKEKEILRPCQAEAEDIDNQCIYWISDKRLDLQYKLLAGTVICSRNLTHFVPQCTYIIVENPRRVFKDILTHHFIEKCDPFVSGMAFVDASVIMGKDVTIDHYAVIESGCIIGDNSVVGSHTVLKRNTIVGKSVVIGCNCTIGGVGFGYEKDQDGQYSVLPHLGNVVIGDFVEIGNNTCIDRAVMGSTLIRKNVKIDNQVHIAHGVEIGENSLVIANSMIAGSVVVGENVWISPCSSVLNKTVIGDNCMIGMGSVVIRNVNSGETIVGNPGKVLSKISV